MTWNPYDAIAARVAAKLQPFFTQLTKEINDMTADQLKALQDSDTALKQAVADVGTRVTKQISDLQAALLAAQQAQGTTPDPAVDAIIADMQADATALQGLAPAPPAPAA